jgi:protocatechuate 3,4-dioxygenase beta subunit
MTTRLQAALAGRRAAMKLLVGGGISATFGCAGADRSPDKLRKLGACIERPRQTEGPYFIDERLQRSDIRSDPTDGSVRPGVALDLALSVERIDGDSCSPFAGALVDVWQCDATGRYSDVADSEARFDTSGKKFLRGSLFTDPEGIARFVTIYPGSYPGRTPHIHFKVRAPVGADKVYELTSQLYFDDALTSKIYQHAPYRARAAADVTNATDLVYRQGGDELLLEVTPSGAGYRAAFALGLRIT